MLRLSYVQPCKVWGTRRVCMLSSGRLGHVPEPADEVLLWLCAVWLRHPWHRHRIQLLDGLVHPIGPPLGIRPSFVVLYSE